MSKHTLHLVLGKGQWFQQVIVRRVTKKTPVLHAGEVAVKLDIDIPYEVLEPKTTALVITKDHIIHPPVTAKQS